MDFEDNQATVQVLDYLLCAAPIVQTSIISIKPQNPHKNLEKSSLSPSSSPSALLSSLPSLSQPKTPPPYPSIAFPVLDMKESRGVKSSAESKVGEL